LTASSSFSSPAASAFSRRARYRLDFLAICLLSI
jgi:hypothetical protein